MIRTIVGTLHALVALTTLLGGLVWAAQARVNLMWELGFYDGPSVVTGAGIAAVVVATALGTLQIVSGLGWLFGHRWAGSVLLGLSVFYALVTPAPFRWLVMLGGMTIIMDLMTRAPRMPQDAPSD